MNPSTTAVILIGYQKDYFEPEGALHDVVLAGVVTAICIDSTARSAFELGYQVSVLSDCTAGRSNYEQEFYCDEVFPLYAQVMTHSDLLEQLR